MFIRTSVRMGRVKCKAVASVQRRTKAVSIAPRPTIRIHTAPDSMRTQTILDCTVNRFCVLLGDTLEEISGRPPVKMSSRRTLSGPKAALRCATLHGRAVFGLYTEFTCLASHFQSRNAGVRVFSRRCGATRDSIQFDSFSSMVKALNVCPKIARALFVRTHTVRRTGEKYLVLSAPAVTTRNNSVCMPLYNTALKQQERGLHASCAFLPNLNWVEGDFKMTSLYRKHAQVLLASTLIQMSWSLRMDFVLNGFLVRRIVEQEAFVLLSQLPYYVGEWLCAWRKKWNCKVLSHRFNSTNFWNATSHRAH